MRRLFDLDKGNYNERGSVFIRPSIRGIVIDGYKVGLIYSKKYDYYKFPGGGPDDGESPVDTLAREMREEAGLIIRRESVKEYGMVHRIQKGNDVDIFIQDNYYFFCEVEEERVPQELDGYEADEGFELRFVNPTTAVMVNMGKHHGPKDTVMLEREARVLRMLMQEGYFKKVRND